MRTHGRTRLLIGVLSLAFAALPASAMAAHDLGIYKVEKHVDMDSDELQVDLACKTGDYAMDGMWRIDHADQDEDDLFKTSLGRAVDVLEAYPSTQSNYRFFFVKNGIGRAQVKVFATCLKNPTEQSSGHAHNITVTPYSSDPQAAVDSYYGNSFSTATSDDPCTGHTFVSTPGFKIDWTDKASAADPEPYKGRMSRSWMTDLKTYEWTHNLEDWTGAEITYYWSCVKRKVVTAGGENHKLVYKLDGELTHPIASKSIKTVRQSCKSHYKAIVAGFAFTPGGPINDLNSEFGMTAPHLWYLGMDPQPKSRDFKFLNGDPAGPHDVKTNAICLNYRTT